MKIPLYLYKITYNNSIATKKLHKLIRNEAKCVFTDLKGRQITVYLQTGGDMSVYVLIENKGNCVFTDRFMLSLILIRCHNGLIMVMSPHKHVTPVR